MVHYWRKYTRNTEFGEIEKRTHTHTHTLYLLLPLDISNINPPRAAWFVILCPLVGRANRGKTAPANYLYVAVDVTPIAAMHVHIPIYIERLRNGCMP